MSTSRREEIFAFADQHLIPALSTILNNYDSRRGLFPVTLHFDSWNPFQSDYGKPHFRLNMYLDTNIMLDDMFCKLITHPQTSFLRTRDPVLGVIPQPDRIYIHYYESDEAVRWAPDQRLQEYDRPKSMIFLRVVLLNAS